MNPISRLYSFYTRNGFNATVVRVGMAFRRFSYFGRMVLFSCPLPIDQFAKNGQVRVERVGRTTISKKDYERLIDVWNPSGRERQMADRFEAGGELWLAKIDDRLAGFGWTIKGRTVEPHFFPLQSGDVHFFDFFVFPDFRGHGVNGALVAEILNQLGGESACRAHIECAAWNTAQLRSLRKTAFRRYGEATKVTFFGHLWVKWHRATAAFLSDR